MGTELRMQVFQLGFFAGNNLFVCGDSLMRNGVDHIVHCVGQCMHIWITAGCIRTVFKIPAANNMRGMNQLVQRAKQFFLQIYNQQENNNDSQSAHCRYIQ